MSWLSHRFTDSAPQKTFMATLAWISILDLDPKYDSPSFIPSASLCLSVSLPYKPNFGKIRHLFKIYFLLLLSRWRYSVFLSQLLLWGVEIKCSGYFNQENIDYYKLRSNYHCCYCLSGNHSLIRWTCFLFSGVGINDSFPLYVRQEG